MATVKPRLQKYYEETVVPRLREAFGLTNFHEVPRLEKVVVNVGLGEAPKNPKLLDSIVEEIALITGQRPVVTRARKSIANFAIREGMPLGAMVTLRGSRMYEFMDRLINVAIPRIRDFRGVPNKAFDGRGNYALGIREQMVFPEIDYDKVQKIHGMDVIVVTSTTKDDQAYALLRELGMPFRGEVPVTVSMEEVEETAGTAAQ